SCSQYSSSRRSPGAVTTVRPASRTQCAVSRASSSSSGRYEITKSAPSRAYAIATARPIPASPPVLTAPRPATRPCPPQACPPRPLLLLRLLRLRPGVLPGRIRCRLLLLHDHLSADGRRAGTPDPGSPFPDAVIDWSTGDHSRSHCANAVSASRRAQAVSGASGSPTATARAAASAVCSGIPYPSNSCATASSAAASPARAARANLPAASPNGHPAGGGNRVSSATACSAWPNRTRSIAPNVTLPTAPFSPCRISSAANVSPAAVRSPSAAAC